jgi:oxygen-independent coproporphyrinogen-3 oxidase
MEALEEGRHEPGARALGDEERVFEFMLNALRLTDGFDIRLFEERTGLPRDSLANQLATLRDKRLIREVESGFWRVTGLGKRFLNDVQAEFLP